MVLEINFLKNRAPYERQIGFENFAVPPIGIINLL